MRTCLCLLTSGQLSYAFDVSLGRIARALLVQADQVASWADRPTITAALLDLGCLFRGYLDPALLANVPFRGFTDVEPPLPRAIAIVIHFM